MNGSDKLKKALIMAEVYDFNEALADVPEFRPSRRHRKHMRRILRGNYEPIRPMSLRKKIAVALVAALVAVLCGCTAYANREKIGGFIKDIFDGHIHLFIDTSSIDSDVPREIEEEYALSYIPEGYELVESESDFADVKYKYLDGEGNYILFRQSTISDSPHGIDTEHTEHSIIEIMGYEVYYTTSKTFGVSSFRWNDGKYMCELSCSINLSFQEMERIFLGIYD